MNFPSKAYRFFSTGLFLTLFPPLWLYTRLGERHQESLKQRLGQYPDRLINGISGSPRIWMHAVSVGEVSVAAAIIRALTVLLPDCAIILSTLTEHGQSYARKKLGSKATCVYGPIDFIGPVRRAFSTLKPDILVCLETEIWPNWLFEAQRAGIKTAIINGRISNRSIKRYLKIRLLIEEALRYVDAFSMISAIDALRVARIGASPDRIEINGNAKYDLLFEQSDVSLIVKMERLYNIKGKQPVFVAGSTRNPEEKIILELYQKIVQPFPNALLIIAPRHVERAQEIKALVQDRGFACQYRTEFNSEYTKRTAPVVVLDTIGELQSTYSIASIVFCGGSLVPLGGQNVLEAAVWGKPVIYGPSMEDFLDAKKLLDSTGGGIQIRDGYDLAEKTLYYLNHPQQAAHVGTLAKKAVMSNRGAAGKHARVIYRLLQRD
jgi:3-deoxy-D-manno-octulosonic-acid transferase